MKSSKGIHIFFIHGLQFKIAEGNLDTQALRIVKTRAENLLRGASGPWHLV